MAVTTLDPKTALVVIDLQQGILARPTVHPAESVLRQAATLADAFRRYALPVVLVTVTGRAPGRTEVAPVIGSSAPGWADLVPELHARAEDHTITKQRWGAFTNTDLEVYLKSRGVTQVVIAGISTSIGVESTARHASEYGFNVTLAIDAMTDMSLEAHINSVMRIFPRLGETGTAGEILDVLAATRT